MDIYFKVYVEHLPNNYYVAPLEEAQQTLKHMREEKSYCPTDEQKYVFEAVEMTEKEFQELPEFQGF